ncbi:hypothetical protein BVY01_00735 [bacterium I07]|nr:hypothetical protein BVY01_00735 [bacterium I07]
MAYKSNSAYRSNKYGKKTKPRYISQKRHRAFPKKILRDIPPEKLAPKSPFFRYRQEEKKPVFKNDYMFHPNQRHYRKRQKDIEPDSMKASKTTERFETHPLWQHPSLAIDWDVHEKDSQSEIIDLRPPEKTSAQTTLDEFIDTEQSDSCLSESDITIKKRGFDPKAEEVLESIELTESDLQFDEIPNLAETELSESALLSLEVGGEDIDPSRHDMVDRSNDVIDQGIEQNIPLENRLETENLETEILKDSMLEDILVKDTESIYGFKRPRWGIPLEIDPDVESI